MVATAADATYFWPSVLALISAGARSTTSTICLLVGDRIRADLVTAAYGAFARSAVPFEYVDADLAEFSSLPLGYWYSRAAYGRLAVPEAGRRFAPRTLYLDADTLAIGDIATLTEIDFGQTHVAAAVRSATIPTCGFPGGISDWEERGLDPTAPFFNSGVLLIDNDRWTSRDVSAQIIADLRRNPQAATFADQGTLNAVLRDQWIELPRQWNYEVFRRPAVRVGPLVVSRRSVFSYSKTKVLHYFMDLKPWDARYPPGFFSAVYRRNWEQFLPTPAPRVDGYRAWLRRRYRG